MDLEELEVTIGKDGQVIINISGVKGNACLDLTRELEQALGNQVVAREMKPEALEQNTESIKPKLQLKGKRS